MNHSNYCWYKLNIDTSFALRDDWIAPSLIVNDIGMKTYEANEIFSNEWLRYMASNNLEITNAISFNRQPYQRDEIAHIDIPSATKLSTFSINWVIGGKNSEMIWYDLPEVMDNMPLCVTPANSLYKCWNIAELTEIDRCKIDECAVVTRVDFPHAIVVRSEPRLSISARTRIRFSWKTAINYIRANNLLVEREL
jgi:hypothetical protein